MEIATAYRYIVKDNESGEPFIQNTRIHVRDIVENWKMRTAPKEIEKFVEIKNVPENLGDTSLPR